MRLITLYAGRYLGYRRWSTVHGEGDGDREVKRALKHRADTRRKGGEAQVRMAEVVVERLKARVPHMYVYEDY